MYWEVIEAEWQSDQLVTFFCHIDLVYERDYYRPVGHRRPCGHGPRRRIRHERGLGKVGNSVAPVGLWRNCYNPEWLSRQDIWTIRALEIIDEDYDFTLNLTRGLVDEASAEKIRDRIKSGDQ